MAKPWEDPEPGGLQVPFTNDLDGISYLVRAITEANELRRKHWLSKYPECHDEINANIDARNKRVERVKRLVDDFRLGVADLEDREEQESMLALYIFNGMALHSEMVRWLYRAAGDGLAQEKGRIEAKKARQVSKEEWSDRKRRALSVMSDVENDPRFTTKNRKKEAAKRLGITPSSLENWLRGGRR